MGDERCCEKEGADPSDVPGLSVTALLRDGNSGSASSVVGTSTDSQLNGNPTSEGVQQNNGTEENKSDPRCFCDSTQGIPADGCGQDSQHSPCQDSSDTKSTIEEHILPGPQAETKVAAPSSANGDSDWEHINWEEYFGWQNPENNEWECVLGYSELKDMWSSGWETQSEETETLEEEYLSDSESGDTYGTATDEVEEGANIVEIEPWETVDSALRWLFKPENARQGPVTFANMWQSCYIAAFEMAQQNNQGEFLCSLLIHAFSEHCDCIRVRLLSEEGEGLVSKVVQEHDLLGAVLHAVSDFLLHVDQLWMPGMALNQATIIYQDCFEFWYDVASDSKFIPDIVALIGRVKNGDKVDEHLIRSGIGILSDLNLYNVRFEPCLLQYIDCHFGRTAHAWVEAGVQRDASMPKINELLSDEKSWADRLYPESKCAALTDVTVKLRLALEPLLAKIVRALLDLERYEDLLWIESTFHGSEIFLSEILNAFKEHMESAASCDKGVECSESDTVDCLVCLWNAFSKIVTEAFRGGTVFWEAICMAICGIARKRNVGDNDFQKFKSKVLATHPLCVQYMGDTAMEHSQQACI